MIVFVEINLQTFELIIYFKTLTSMMTELQIGTCHIRLINIDWNTSRHMIDGILCIWSNIENRNIFIWYQMG